MTERLFVAINFTAEFIHSLDGVQQALRGRLSGGNFSKTENLHLTLAFIGETDRRRAAVCALSRVTGSPFDISLCGGGAFGKGLYYAALDRCPPLAALAKRVAHELSEEGFSLENRVFKPHITLVRQGVSCGKVIFPHCDAEMRVHSFELMKSERSNGRLCYKKLASFPLSENNNEI